MKFDMARKVVKFQNGQFGIRRWTWIGYQFLDLTDDDFYWWTSEDCIERHCVGSESSVRTRLSEYLKPLAQKVLAPGYDKGRSA
jgi:hypothetical protein